MLSYCSKFSLKNLATAWFANRRVSRLASCVYLAMPLKLCSPPSNGILALEVSLVYSEESLFSSFKSSIISSLNTFREVSIRLK